MILKARIHPKAVYQAIDFLFSERVNTSDLNPTDTIVPTQQFQEGVHYTFRAIDTRNPKALLDLAENRLNDFLQKHPDNTKWLFIEMEMQQAKKYQSCLPEYKSNREPKQKEYFFKLERWIEALEKMRDPRPDEIEGWVDWMLLNPELAEKLHPKLMQEITDGIRKSEPYKTALLIQKLPDHFPKWRENANNYFGIKRAKMIQSYIALIKKVLFEYEYPSEIEQKAVESVRDELSEQLEYWEKEAKETRPEQAEALPDPETIETGPIFNPDCLPSLLDILKGYFGSEQQLTLKQLFETGKIGSGKLLFKGNGNQLTDSLRKLFDCKLITGCNKNELIEWILSNFAYLQRQKPKPFNKAVVQRIISGNDKPCRSPLIEIEGVQIARKKK